MIYAIFILCLILFAIAIYALRKLSKQYKTLQEIYYLQKLMLSHSQFTNDANEMILWKIRYDIWCWNENLVKAENYEARTFSTTGFVDNVTYESKVKITDGKVLEKAATTPSGMPADSIVYMVQFDDDEDGLTYIVSGFRRTGFPADDF